MAGPWDLRESRLPRTCTPGEGREAWKRSEAQGNAVRLMPLSWGRQREERHRACCTGGQGQGQAREPHPQDRQLGSAASTLGIAPRAWSCPGTTGSVDQISSTDSLRCGEGAEIKKVTDCQVLEFNSGNRDRGKQAQACPGRHMRSISRCESPVLLLSLAGGGYVI